MNPIDGGGCLPWLVLGGLGVLGYVYALNKLLTWWLA